MPAIIVDGKLISFTIEGSHISCNGAGLDFHVIRQAPGRLVVKTGNSVREIFYSDSGSSIDLSGLNTSVTVEVLSDRELLLRSLDTGESARHRHSEIKAPMPGLVVSINVKNGDSLKRGGTLLILEAMKMENEIRTPSDVTVSEVLVQKGDIVEKDQVIVKLA